ncbi:MAG: hypothetical protein KDC98_12160 [Planctomycetes bacterium]|nr:hypothetical protein [Planctomycetota bacterium]
MSFLGFDIGGTSCRYEWWPEGVHAGGTAAGAHPVVHGIDATVRSLSAVCAEAARVAVPRAAVAAMAGAGDAKVAAALAAGLRDAGVEFPIAIVGDVLAAAAAGLRDGPGVLLWSGTGSFAVARAANGALVRVGGRGYLLGDQGSGYDLVRRAAAAVLLALDGLGPATELTDSLTAAFGAPAPARLGAVLQSLDTRQVAQRLPVVVEAAAAGDQVAVEVFEAGAEALAALANAAARGAELDLRGRTVVFGGGVPRLVPAFAERVVARLASLGAAATVTIDDRAAARGAAWLAHGVHHGLEPQSSWVRHVTL